MELPAPVRLVIVVLLFPAVVMAVFACLFVSFATLLQIPYFWGRSIGAAGAFNVVIVFGLQCFLIGAAVAGLLGFYRWVSPFLLDVGEDGNVKKTAKLFLVGLLPAAQAVLYTWTDGIGIYAKFSFALMLVVAVELVSQAWFRQKSLTIHK